MKKVLVICEAGITTSLLVAKLEDQAQESKIEVEIHSKSTLEGIDTVKGEKVDVILLGPQIHHEEEAYAEVSDAVIKKISVLDYNNMNAYSVFDQIKEAL